jgi:hypothetical protein
MPASQAGRRRFEPGRPLYNIKNLRDLETASALSSGGHFTLPGSKKVAPCRFELGATARAIGESAGWNSFSTSRLRGRAWKAAGAFELSNASLPGWPSAALRDSEGARVDQARSFGHDRRNAGPSIVRAQELSIVCFRSGSHSSYGREQGLRHHAGHRSPRTPVRTCPPRGLRV